MKWASAIFVIENTTSARSAFPFQVDISKATKHRTFMSLLHGSLIEGKLGPCAELEKGWNMADIMGFTSEENAIVAQVLVDRHAEDMKVFEQA